MQCRRFCSFRAGRPKYTLTMTTTQKWTLDVGAATAETTKCGKCAALKSPVRPAVCCGQLDPITVFSPQKAFANNWTHLHFLLTCNFIYPCICLLELILLPFDSDRGCALAKCTRISTCIGVFTNGYSSPAAVFQTLSRTARLLNSAICTVTQPYNSKV